MNGRSRRRAERNYVPPGRRNSTRNGALTWFFHVHYYPGREFGINILKTNIRHGRLGERMKYPDPVFGFCALSVVVCAMSAGLACSPAAKPGTRTIAMSALEDKVRGGWAGKMIGVSFGAPTEFSSNGRINESELPPWKPERVENAIHQDDLYVGMTMSETMDRLGLEATTEEFGEAFRVSQYGLWHANAAARRLLNLGLKAPMSGHPLYNIHANDIDFQIEADFIGLMCPGLPREASKYSDRVGRVMNYGDGLYGGMFLNGMYAAAFFESDVREVVEAGWACLPRESEYARLIRDVLDWSAKDPGDWKKTWRLVENKWDKDESCPDGALDPFNIDAKINGGYIAIGLLFGGKDFGRTIEIAARCGQDSDCNPSSAGGVLGVILGYGAIPDFWKSGIPALADVKFEYTRSSFNDISRATLARALEVVRAAGGKVTKTAVTVPTETPVPARLEQWTMGVPDRRLGFKDASWAFKGGWKPVMAGEKKQDVVGMSASGAGAEAVLTFTGSAVSIQGLLDQEGGRADVYVDGKRARDMDCYIVPRTFDSSLWHVYGLEQGTHAVRIVARADADPRSTGKKIVISGAVIYRNR